MYRTEATRCWRIAGVCCGAITLLLTGRGHEARAQSEGDGRPGQMSFEVASVRITPPGNRGLTSISPYGTGRFTATNATLQLLIELAFGVSEAEIVSAPGWLDTERYDVNVKASGDAKLTYEQLKPPMQALLKERFRLATHSGTKEVAGYALVAAKSGPKLKPGAGSKSQPMILPKGLQAEGMSMATLAGMLARVAGRPVVDKTGLTGLYDIKLSYAPANGSDASLPSLFTALQEQIGLKLEPRKVMVETLVIDHVERIPSEN